MKKSLRNPGCSTIVILCALVAAIVLIILAAWYFTRGPFVSGPPPTFTYTPTPTHTPTPTPTLTPTPTPTPVPDGVKVVADFDQCSGGSNLDTSMGAACPGTDCRPPDNLVETYELGPGRDQCSAKLEYNISSWSAFWIKLPRLDLTPYDRLTFQIRADPGFTTPKGVKVELKRSCSTTGDVTGCAEVWYKWQRFPDQGVLESAWFTSTVRLGSLTGPAGSSLTDMEELVFTFVGGDSGFKGVIYLDDVWFR